MQQDRYRLRQAIDKAVRQKTSLDRVDGAITKSVARVRLRRQSLPVCILPPELPVSQQKQNLVDMIRKHPVLVVCGETGSGKSTQLPKICIEAGYGATGMICQTQPRRIAARSVAERIAEELGSEVGEQIGYRVRFSEKIAPQNIIRVLTDGMLLAEFEQDRWLSRYDVLIIDEAHERSLNIDFLLGLTSRILKQRPDFRLIITSATLDSEKFSKHFNAAPAVTVSGRSYPVEVRYRPVDAELPAEEALPASIHSAVEELHQHALGDVLVFLPGEREIQETARWLGKRLKSGIEILPLYARLTPKEQHRIFHPGHNPRIILATNVAETSLTVPGVKYVVDAGVARISRYSPSRKIQRLPIEKVSRSAADQRAGRCGRTSDGICIRLYSEEDYLGRPQYADPEILRTSLADVILRMKSLRLNDIEVFPFIDKPSRKQINDGMQQLLELGALDQKHQITTTGKQIARMPVDPRVARMLLAASALDCLQEVIVIAAALSIPDPRLNPADKLQHSRQVHREMSSESSDFMLMLDIWQQFRVVQKNQSKRQGYRWCEEHFLSIFRMREWGALQANIKSVLKQLKFSFNQKPADADLIHRALLPGLLSNVAQLAMTGDAGQRKNAQQSVRKNKGAEYLGTFGKTVKIFPGSVVHGKTPKWIMSAELVETTQLYARMVDGIQPQWLESTAQHLLQFHYSDPRWDIRQERVVAKRRGTLYGLTVFSGRRCDYSSINPEDCRKIFIRSALVDGEIASRMRFFRDNQLLVRSIESMENKTRRRDLLVDDSVIFDFYDERIPAEVNSVSSLRKWHKKLSDQQRLDLLIPRELLMSDQQLIAPEVYPDSIANNGIELDLHYHFDPGAPKDGVTAQIRLPLLNQMNAAVFERLVPGLLREKLVQMVRSLPKVTRRHLVPVPDTVDNVFEQVKADREPLAVALARNLNLLKGLSIHATDFDFGTLPDYLNMGLELIDENENVLGFSRDLAALKAQFGSDAHASFVDKGDASIERVGIIKWDFDELPKSINVRVGSYQTSAYPALVDCTDSVAIEIFDDETQAAYAHQEGLRRLLWLTLPQHRKMLKKPLPDWQRISLMYAAIGDLEKLQVAMFYKAQDRVFFEQQAEVRSKPAFDILINKAAPRLSGELVEIAQLVSKSLVEYRQVQELLNQHANKLSKATRADIVEQFEWLIYDGFVDDIPVSWLSHLPRFLKAACIRLQQALLDPATDALRQQKTTVWWRQYLECDFAYSEVLEQYRWMVEEYRVSVFAQNLKTSQRISAKRLEQAWQAVLQHQLDVAAQI